MDYPLYIFRQLYDAVAVIEKEQLRNVNYIGIRYCHILYGLAVIRAQISCRCSLKSLNSQSAKGWRFIQQSHQFVTDLKIKKMNYGIQSGL